MEKLQVTDTAAVAIPAHEMLQGDINVAAQQHVDTPTKFSHATLEGVRQQMATFASDRNWEQHHTPRNLVLALTGEMGELAECFQWKGDSTSVDDWPTSERVHLGEELSDVALYLIRLADRCNIDLAAAIQDKMIKNARKYPAHLVNGSSAKYTAYADHTSSDDNVATQLAATSATAISSSTMDM